MPRTFLIFVFFSFSFFACTPMKAKQNVAFSTKEETVLPFEYIDNRIFLDVFINHKGPFKFIFDTGSTNVITPQVALALGLSTQTDVDGTGAGENRFRVDKADIRSFHLGDIEFIDQGFSVIDMSSIQKAFNMKTFDGAFGYEVLQKYRIQIDFEHNRIIFNSNLTPFDEKNFKKIPFQIVHNKPVVEAKINGIMAMVLVDTGDRSALTIFNNFLVHSAIAKVFAGQKEQITGFGGGGPIPAKLGYIEEIQIDDFLIKNSVARTPTTVAGFNALKNMNASIGNEILSQFNVAFDYKNKFIFLAKNSKFGTQTKFTRVPNP